MTSSYSEHRAHCRVADCFLPMTSFFYSLYSSFLINKCIGVKPTPFMVLFRKMYSMEVWSTFQNKAINISLRSQEYLVTCKEIMGVWYLKNLKWPRWCFTKSSKSSKKILHKVMCDMKSLLYAVFHHHFALKQQHQY